MVNTADEGGVTGVFFVPYTDTATNETPHATPQVLPGLITTEQREFVVWVFSYITQVFNITGIVSNSFSIAVFVRLGFAEPSNISLFALALSDLTASILSFWICINIFPVFRYANLPFSPINVPILTGSGIWTQIIRTIAWITAFISVERCLCILIPLKVKRLITPKTTTIIILIIAVISISPMVTVYLRWYFVWRYYPNLNRTILDIGQNDDPKLVLMEYVYNNIAQGVIVPLLAFIIVVVCTVFLVIHLRRSTAWRQSVASTKSQSTELSDTKENTQQSARKGISSKEERLVKMVTSVAIIFIISFTPCAVLVVGTLAFAEFTAFGRYRNMYVVSFVVTFLGQSVSASLNILIYYNMGTKYRSTLRYIIGLDRKV